MPAHWRNVKEVGDLMTRELATEAPEQQYFSRNRIHEFEFQMTTFVEGGRLLVMNLMMENSICGADMY